MLKSKTSRWLAGPYLLWMAIFTVVPLVIVVWYAMTNADGQFTLDNLTQIGRYSSVFARSLILAAISTVVCLVMAFPVGYFLSRLRANKQHIMLMLIMLPMWMNFLLRTYAWMTLLEKNGLINKFFGLFGLGPFNMINTSGAVVLGMVYNYLPFMILPIYTAMTKIDDSIVEAAQDLGCNVWQILFRVLVPLTGPGIATGITQVFVPAVSTFIISRMLGGGSNLLIGDLIELQFLGNSYNLNLGSAMSLVLMVKLNFGSYCRKIENAQSPNAWLSRDKSVVKAYDADGLCTFRFTAATYREMLATLNHVSTKAWAQAIDKDLPVLLIAGDCDPVGDYGSGVRKVWAMLGDAGVRDLTCQIFEGGRHELHNETNRDEVFDYVLTWIEDHIS